MITQKHCYLFAPLDCCINCVKTFDICDTVAFSCNILSWRLELLPRVFIGFRVLILFFGRSYLWHTFRRSRHIPLIQVDRIRPSSRVNRLTSRLLTSSKLLTRDFLALEGHLICYWTNPAFLNNLFSSFWNIHRPLFDNRWLQIWGKQSLTNRFGTLNSRLLNYNLNSNADIFWMILAALLLPPASDTILDLLPLSELEQSSDFLFSPTVFVPVNSILMIELPLFLLISSALNNPSSTSFRIYIMCNQNLLTSKTSLRTHKSLSKTQSSCTSKTMM